MFRSKYKNYNANLSFLDLLFQLILGFTFLFIVSVMLISPKKDGAQIHTKAEFIVTLTWDDNNQDDVDLWIEDPNGQTLWYREKEVGLMHLDRDDLGNINDNIILANGEHITFPYNQEIGTIRGNIVGEWTINVHMYAKREIIPTNVLVKIEKLNPTVRTILLKRIIIVNPQEEVTIIRLEMGDTGSILSTSELPKSLIRNKLTETMGP